MEELLNLKSYQRYQDLIDDGLILVPDNILTKLLKSLKGIQRAKPMMLPGETHEVELNAKKVKITSRGSLREIAIDGIHYDSISQAACSMYDHMMNIIIYLK